ncbi:MAG: hypothetical protein ACFCVD_05855 [Nodosilinea sp.]
MLHRLRRRFGHFFRQARTVNNEPVNRASLAVIILIDIFILVNVFIGLDDIGQWPLSPAQTYPCYAPWSSYQTQTQANQDSDILRSAIPPDPNAPFRLVDNYRQGAVGHLGQVSTLCLDYGAAADALNTTANRQIITTLNQTEQAIGKLEEANRTIREQYDSTLLEEIAGQPRDQSINQTEAAQAKQTLAQNEATKKQLQQTVSDLRTELSQTPESQDFLSLLNNPERFEAVKQRYNRASFWYPSLQMVFQGLFLLPLIVAAWLAHRLAQRRGYGLVALLSWHLLVIFCIPLVVKTFQFLQVGVLFEWLSRLAIDLLGGLLFLVNYFYILLIPLVGYGLIKSVQRVVLNLRLQVAGRVQKRQCIRCAKQVRSQDTHCPHCGYGQYVECPHCHHRTYKYLPHCRHCGATQDLGRLG